jgi:mRNA interferase MazF
VSLRQGDIWWVQCNPSTGHEYQGERPCLILQASACIPLEGVVTVMIMTTHTKDREWKDDVFVKKDGSNRLHADSLIKVQYIMSFDQNRLIKRIGVVDSSTMSKVKSYLARHFGLSS